MLDIHLFDPSCGLRNGLEVGNVVGGEVRVLLQEPSHVTVHDLAAAGILFRTHFKMKSSSLYCACSLGNLTNERNEEMYSSSGHVNSRPITDKVENNVENSIRNSVL